MLGISGASQLLDLSIEEIQFNLNGEKQDVFSEPVELSEWGNMGNQAFRELKQELKKSGLDLNTFSLEQARDYGGVVDKANSVVGADQVGAILVLKTQDNSQLRYDKANYGFDVVSFRNFTVK